MIGPGASSYLRRLAASATRRALMRRLAVWFAAVLLASSLLSAAGFLSLLSETGYRALLVLLLSTFPLALFFPPGDRAGIRELRALDRAATLESALAAPEGGASEPLLRARGESLARELGTAKSPRLVVSQGERALFATAATAFIALQALLILTTGGPALGYVAPAVRAGREEEGELAFARRNASEETAFEDFPGDEAAESDPAMPGIAERRGSEADFEKLHGLTRAEETGGGSERGDDYAPPGQTGSPGSLGAAEAPQGDGARRSVRPAEDPSRGGEADGGGSESGDKAPSEETREDGRSPGSGWSASPGASAGDAMKDYRAAFEKVYSERTRGAVAAGSELSRTDLETALDRYFESFSLRIGMQPAEDPFAAGLRAAWARLREGLR